MYYLPKINGNKTSIFIIIFMFIMIIPSTAIILTSTTITIPVYGQQPDQTSLNATDSSNIQSIPAKIVHVGDIEIAYKMLEKVTLFYFSMDLLMVWMAGTRPFQGIFLQITQ